MPEADEQPYTPTDREQWEYFLRLPLSEAQREQFLALIQQDLNKLPSQQHVAVLSDSEDEEKHDDESVRADAK